MFEEIADRLAFNSTSNSLLEEVLSRECNNDISSDSENDFVVNSVATKLVFIVNNNTSSDIISYNNVKRQLECRIKEPNSKNIRFPIDIDIKNSQYLHPFITVAKIS